MRHTYLLSEIVEHWTGKYLLYRGLSGYIFHLLDQFNHTAFVANSSILTIRRTPADVTHLHSYIIPVDTLIYDTPGRPNYLIFVIGRGYSDSLGLGGPGIESRCGRELPQASRTVLGPTQPPVQRLLRLFLGGKSGGA